MNLESVVAEKRNESRAIEALLEAASEYHLEAEVVWELCKALKEIPGISIEDAAFRAFCEWDL